MARRAETVADALRLRDGALRDRDAGRLVDALTGAGKALSILERNFPDHTVDRATVMSTVGAVEASLGRYEAARRSFEQAQALLASAGGDERTLAGPRLEVLVGLAGIARAEGRLDQAERLLLDALSLAEGTLGAAAIEVAGVRKELGMVYKYAARFDEAEALYRQALPVAVAVQGAGQLVAAIWHNLGGVEHARGRFAEGEAHARRSVEIREATLGPDHPAVAADVAALAAHRRCVRPAGALVRPLRPRSEREQPRPQDPRHPELLSELVNSASRRRPASGFFF